MENLNYEIIDPNYPDLAYDRTLTFAGVLRKYFTQHESSGRAIGISRNWNPQTQSSYIRDYNLRLFPLMDRNKPIGEYTAEEFNGIVEQLRAEHQYSEISVNHYRRLIWEVCQAGYKNGHCDDILWGTCFSLANKERNEKLKTQSLVVLKKSFTIHEELRIFQLLTKGPESISGEELGLLIMLFTGVRNNEACGMNFEDIKPMVEHPESYCIWVYKTTELDSSELKASGKTRNADRILPILDNLRDFILERMHYLEKLILTGELILTGKFEGKTVLELPIVCKGNHYLKRCFARDLTRAGRELLKEIKIAANEVAVLDEILQSREFFSEGIEEKDPTTYLFRRNAGTHLYTLGFSMSEIQYYIGQDVEDVYEDRNSFVNEEKLYALKKLLDKHPFNYIFSEENKNQQPASIIDTPYIQNVADATYRFTSDEEDTCIMFSLKAREPKEKVSFTINSSNPIEISLQKKAEPVVADRTVNIHQMLRRVYEAEIKRLDEILPIRNPPPGSLEDDFS